MMIEQYTSDPEILNAFKNAESQIKRKGVLTIRNTFDDKVELIIEWNFSGRHGYGSNIRSKELKNNAKPILDLFVRDANRFIDTIS